jgi:hypothetical protein
MQKSAEEINAVVATNTGLEATIKGRLNAQSANKASKSAN